MTKRKRKSGAPNETELSAQKRTRQSNDPSASAPIASQSISYGRVDPTYGQRSAIPGLDDEYDSAAGLDAADADSDVEYSIDKDALSYLRSVRVEASGIPTLLVAPRARTIAGDDGDRIEGDEDGGGVDRGIYEDGIGDSRGWYDDGAYTAAAAAPVEAGSTAAAALEGSEGRRGAQEAYHEALLGRFEALRRALVRVPPRHAVERLDADHGCWMSPSVKDCKLWRWRLGNTEPRPAQLAGMDKATVLRLLRMIGDGKEGLLSMGELEAGRRRVSLWVWGLLARLPGSGELVSEEVGVVRELGKRAVWVGVEMKGMDMGGLQELMEVADEEEEGELGDGDVVDVEIERGSDHLDLEADDEAFINGDEIISRLQYNDASSPQPRTSSKFLNPEAAPMIGPLSPESLRGQLFQHSRDLSTGVRSDVINDEGQEQDEAETLSRARDRLLARLDSQDALPTSDTRDAGTETETATAVANAADTEDGEWSEGEIEEDGEEHDHDHDRKEVAVQHQNPTQQLEQQHNSGNGDAAEEEEEDTTPTATDMHATKTLLDMILTVAGEAYGQRDLLEFREVWA